MSIKATNFVRSLRGLTAFEKDVAYTLADHANHKSAQIYVGMDLLAEEAGLADRRVAGRITARLVEYKVIRTPRPSKGRNPTVYFFNYDLANCDSRVTVALPRTGTPQSRLNRDPTGTLQTSNRDSEPVGNSPTGTLEASNRDSPVPGRVLRELQRKGKPKKGLAALAARPSSTGERLVPPVSPYLTARSSRVIDEFGEEVYLVLLKFEAHRKKIRKPLTEYGLELLLKKLGELRAKGNDPVKVLERSIMQGWSGIFPLEKERTDGHPKSFHERRSEQSAQAIEEVLGRFEKASRNLQRALPPTRK